MSVVHHRDPTAAWELWLATFTQHGERVLYHIPPAQERIKIKKSKYRSVEYISLLHLFKDKNLKCNHHSLRIPCITEGVEFK